MLNHSVKKQEVQGSRTGSVARDCFIQVNYSKQATSHWLVCPGLVHADGQQTSLLTLELEIAALIPQILNSI